MKSVPFSAVRAAHSERIPGGKWFSHGAMEFFGTKLPKSAVQVGEQFVFITSELDFDRCRRFNVRVMNAQGGIDTQSDFCSIETSEAAELALLQVVRDLELARSEV